MKVVIYQIEDLQNCKYGFMPYKFALEHGFSSHHYEKVAEAEYEEENTQTLNKIFADFNVGEQRRKHPNMRSLSVSDVITFENGGSYYVDEFGFAKLPERI